MATRARVPMLIGLLCLLGLPVGSALGQDSSPRPAAAKPPLPAAAADGRYIVLYDESVADVDAETDRQERGRGFRAAFRYRRAVRGFAARLNDGQARGLRADPDVASVTPDRPVHALGAVPLAAGEPIAPPGVRRIQAATSTTTRQASDVGVAVIDTGIDLSHPDLNAVSGRNCVIPGAQAQDDEGHGTHVAGTIAARNNGAGVLGVAPGTKLYAVKVLDSTGSGTWSQVICGIDWVTANASALNIRVANLSLGGPGTNDNNCGLTAADPLHQAICRSTQAGVMNVVAAGNDRWDIGDTPPDTPASYPEVLTVTAMGDTDGTGGGTGANPSCRSGERDDAFATFSNYATRAGDAAHMVAAPGVCIRSTLPGGAYGTMSGTSMASPHVAGAVALCLSEGGAAGPCAGRTPAQIVAHVRSTAEAHARADATYGFAGDPLRPNSFGDYYGFLARVAPDATAPETTLSGGPTGTVAATGAQFAFGSADPGARFECRLDAAAWAACTSPRTLSGLGEGPHTFAVRSIDAAGNVDATPATRTWTVDTVTPDTAIAGGPSGLTADSTPTFDLTTSEAGAGFQCRVDGGAWTACATPHTTAALADGAHTLEARAVDAAGNVDATPASRAFTVDATVPDTTIASGPDGVTKNATPTFEFASGDASAAFECRVDGGAWASCASPHRTATLSEGSHTFEVRALDAAGNRDATPAARTFRVDPAALASQPPSASAQPAGNVTAGSATLNGTLDPHGDATTWWFEYGTTTAYGQRTAQQALAGEPAAVAASIAGLAAGTTYHYRIVARNSAGTTTSGDRTFATAAAPAPAPAPTGSTSPAPTGTTASPASAPTGTTSWPAAAPDRTPPRLTLTTPRRTLRAVLTGGLRLTVRCAEACTVSAPVRLSGPAAKRLGLARTVRAVTVGRAFARLPAATSHTLVVRLTAAARRRLARVRGVTLTVRVTARDRAGNATIATRRIVLRG